MSARTDMEPLSRWLATHAPLLGASLADPIAEEALAETETLLARKLPSDDVAFLREHDGQRFGQVIVVSLKDDRRAVVSASFADFIDRLVAVPDDSAIETAEDGIELSDDALDGLLGAGRRVFGSLRPGSRCAQRSRRAARRELSDKQAGDPLQ